MRTAALVVDWGQPAETEAALRSLADMRPAPDILIRVDNGSPAKGVPAVREKAPRDTIFIDLSMNIGWPSAVNIGMERAIAEGADWILVLNNDAIVESSCLSKCVREANRHSRVAVVGPAVAFFDRPDKLWFAGGDVNPWFAFTRHRGLMKSSDNPPRSSATGFVSGCCFMVSAAAWQAIGPFRGDYFAYYEDAEWCQRAAALGWQCRYLGEVLCWHKVSVTWSRAGSLGLSAGMAYYLARNPLRFSIEAGTGLRRVSRVLGILTIWNAYNAVRVLQSRDIRVAGAYIEGLRDAVRGRMGQRPAHEAGPRPA
jgi:GT2 family glycosyltransferase